MKHLLSFLCIRMATFPFAYLPTSWTQKIGQILGTATFYLYPKFRKRTLSNLALVLSLSEHELVALAKKSMQNLMITVLEYAKLSSLKDIHQVAYCQNPETAQAIIDKGQGVIFFCGHQANWEVLFIEGTKRMPGVAIGRPVKNQFLYRWVLKLREQNGGKIIAPQNAIRESLRALKKGSFLGIVGDQGMPDSGFSSPFFNKNAWTSPMPALLAYRTGCPIIVATTRREGKKYCITYSNPIFPNQEESQEKEIARLMETSLGLLEQSILEKPEEWLWQHNRWKQQTVGRIKRAFRLESLLILLPNQQEAFEQVLPHLSSFREAYPLEFMTVYSPFATEAPLIKDAEILTSPNELDKYRFKLIFNLTEDPKLHLPFLKCGAIKGVHMPHFTADALKRLVYAT
jgi:Kdo2-lipid IVA lauroyltransferase/acyltransferase